MLNPRLPPYCRTIALEPNCEWVLPREVAKGFGKRHQEEISRRDTKKRHEEETPRPGRGDARDGIDETEKKPEIVTMPVRVKICGITRVEDALAAAYLGAHAVGFVFWRRSARYITPESARDIIAALPPFLTKVGVYVDPDPEWVEETSSLAGLDLLQFHGDEPEEFCRQFALPYIKAVRVRVGLDLLQYATLYKGASGLLLDTFMAGEPGGTGHAFDWDLIPRTLPLPLILSGGLHPGNIAEAIQCAQPWAVDVSSGVEAAKGIKDAEKIAALMRGVRTSERL
jgi:phosphoribosylanthranilate isomerase